MPEMPEIPISLGQTRGGLANHDVALTICPSPGQARNGKVRVTLAQGVVALTHVLLTYLAWYLPDTHTHSLSWVCTPHREWQSIVCVHGYA